MNCENFAQRMYERLDQRMPPESDHQLARHASDCTNCRSQLEMWGKIAPLMTPDTPVPGAVAEADLSADLKGLRAILPLMTAGLAAAILIAVVGISPTKPSPQPTIVDAPTSSSTPILAQATGELDPVVWWRSVQDRDWVGETMPTVRSVKEGVAPLGRMLVRAVTILTIGGEGRTS
jgi:hypothetical protein